MAIKQMKQFKDGKDKKIKATKPVWQLRVKVEVKLICRNFYSESSNQFVCLQQHFEEMFM